MNPVISNVRDLGAHERQALEAVVGHALDDNEQVIVHVVSRNTQDAHPNGAEVTNDASALKLPDWCDVYDGLTDEEIADLEKAILQRADLTRA